MGLTLARRGRARTCQAVVETTLYVPSLVSVLARAHLPAALRPNLHRAYCAQGRALPRPASGPAATEVEDAVIRILLDALTNPAMLLERLGTAGIPGELVRKLLGRAARLAAALNGSPGSERGWCETLSRRS
jgi:hypothetical protein